MGIGLDRRALERPDSLTRAPRFARSPEFRLRAVGSRCGGKRYLSSRRTCKSTRGYNFNVELGKTKSTWSIQPKAGAYSIVDANANAKGCPYRYLALGPDTDQSSGMADYEEDEIELVTSRWDGPWVLISTDVRSHALTLSLALRVTRFARSPDTTANGTLSPRATWTGRARNTVLKTSSCSRATGIPTSITRGAATALSSTVGPSRPRPRQTRSHVLTRASFARRRLRWRMGAGGCLECIFYFRLSSIVILGFIAHQFIAAPCRRMCRSTLPPKLGARMSNSAFGLSVCTQ